MANGIYIEIKRRILDVDVYTDQIEHTARRFSA